MDIVSQFCLSELKLSHPLLSRLAGDKRRSAKELLQHFMNSLIHVTEVGIGLFMVWFSGFQQEKLEASFFFFLIPE